MNTFAIKLKDQPGLTIVLPLVISASFIFLATPTFTNTVIGEFFVPANLTIAFESFWFTALGASLINLFYQLFTRK